jgi:hypothetical protein
MVSKMAGRSIGWARTTGFSRWTTLACKRNCTASSKIAARVGSNVWSSSMRSIAIDPAAVRMLPGDGA